MARIRKLSTKDKWEVLGLGGLTVAVAGVWLIGLGTVIKWLF